MKSKLETAQAHNAQLIGYYEANKYSPKDIQVIKKVEGMIEKPAKKTDLDDKLWKIFSLYIRTRDALATTGNTEFCRCVTCWQVKPFSEMDCGHCFGRDKDGTKYEEHNNHAQCRPCNGHRCNHGEIYAHKMYIRMTYGQDELDRLEYLSKKVVIQRRDDWYKEKIEYYTQKLAELK